MADLIAEAEEYPDAEVTTICPWCEQPLWVRLLSDGTEVWYCENSDCYANEHDKMWSMLGHCLHPEDLPEADRDEDDREEGR